jgi:hypothetical protein
MSPYETVILVTAAAIVGWAGWRFSRLTRNRKPTTH